MSKLDNFLFYMGISIFLLCILFTFFFFSPKKIKEVDSLFFLGNLGEDEILNNTLAVLDEGDIILTKPKSLYDSYEYKRKTRESSINRIGNFFFYNMFDKILINSMGDTYWHAGIYIGNKTMNSLYLDNRNELIDKNFVKHKYFKVLNVKVKPENKKLAIKRAKEHFEKQDLYYSLKNGLLIVYLESIKSKKVFDIKENELVCSSYVAFLYNEVNFTNKPFTHTAPINLEFSRNVDAKIMVNKTGVYIKNENR